MSGLTPEELEELAAIDSALGLQSGPPFVAASLTPEDEYEMQAIDRKIKGENFFDRLEGDMTRRGEQAVKLTGERALGQIGKAEFGLGLVGQVGGGAVADVTGQAIKSAMLTAKDIDSFLGGYGGKATQAAADAISNISFSDTQTLGEFTKESVLPVVKTGAEKTMEFMEGHPRTARGLESAINLAAIGIPAAKWGDDVLENTYRATKGLTKKDVARLNSQQVAAIGGGLFQKADAIGGKLKPEFWDNYLDDVGQKLTRKTSIGKDLDIASGTRQTLDKVEDVLSNYRGQPQGFSSIKDVDEVLGELAYGSLDNVGNMTREGKQFLTLQRTLRESIDAAPDSIFIGGREAFKTVEEARRFWAASRRMQDVERVILSAKDATGQPATILKNGFRRIRKGKDFKYYTPEEQFAINRAAKTGTIEGFLKLQGSGLGPIIAGAAGMATGGPVAAGAAAVPAHLLREGMKGASEAIAGNKAQNVLDVIQAGATKSPVYLPGYYGGEAVKALGKTVTPIGIMSSQQKETLSERTKRLMNERRKRGEQ